MSKIKVIYGDRETGKSTLARLYGKFKNVVYTDENIFHYFFLRGMNDLNPDTNLIIVDDINSKKFDPERIYEILGPICVNRRSCKPFEIYPDYILVFDYLTDADIEKWPKTIKNRIEFIKTT